jgi:predicted nucleic acid-binding protein
MIIADTSVWIYHFRHGLLHFAHTLQNGLIAIHPIVLGELATGNLLNRPKTLAALRCLPKTQIGTVDECMQFIETHRLDGRGIGWNDIQILVAARLSGNPLWSKDRRLADAAKELGISYLDH